MTYVGAMSTTIRTLFLLLVSACCIVHLHAQKPKEAYCGELGRLKVGDVAPVFATKDHQGDSVVVPAAVPTGPVVLVFYRGSWCPYCNKHMSQLQDSLQLLLDRNATVIAVSPETPESADEIIQKSGATFHVVHDEGYRIMCAYGTAFVEPEGRRRRLKLVGYNVDKANGNTEGILPVPATFIIGTDGRIKALHFEENHKERMSVKAILEALE